MQTPKPDQDSQHCIVLSTCPSQEVAEAIAAKLVENKLAACVNIVSGLTSVYEWQGKVETDREHLLIAKTVAAAYQAVENTILDSHPYELPEIVSIPINNGLANYLSWIDDCIAPIH